MRGAPRAVVWTGEGASHSWVWWADLLEDLGWLDAVFPRDAEGLRAGLSRRDLLLLGGGEVGRMGRSMDLASLRQWVWSGGRLVASCAGAYLLRTWAGVGIANAAIGLPASANPRAWTECEEGVVVHMVRGPVRIETADGTALTAPLFGGPVFREPGHGPAMVAARYSGVARGAEWLLADRPDLLEGTPAVVVAPLGDGHVVLTGPHLEHPDHRAAHLWLAGLLGWGPGPEQEGPPPPRPGTDPTGEEVVRRLATARRRAAALSGLTWRSGEKLWSGDRVAGFVDAILPRARALARWGWGPRGEAGQLLDLLEVAEQRLGLRDRPDAWDEGFSLLSEVGASLMNAYFASRRSGMTAPPGRATSRPPRLAWAEGAHATTAGLSDGMGVGRG